MTFSKKPLNMVGEFLGRGRVWHVVQVLYSTVDLASNAEKYGYAVWCLNGRLALLRNCEDMLDTCS